MDESNEISENLREYSSHVLKDEDENEGKNKGKELYKCECLSKSDIICKEYTDCWLLLCKLLYRFDEPSFYSIRSGNTDEGYQLLRIKFLSWLELIYKKTHEIADPQKVNPIEFIRRSEYNDFFKYYGSKFGLWKAETFRGLFDSNPDSNIQSLKDFKDNSSLLKKEDLDQEEKSIYEALSGNKNKILELLPKNEDPHNEMWAELFSSYINDTKVEFTIQKVKECREQGALEFQKYCFKLDLFRRLCFDQIIDTTTFINNLINSGPTIDFDSLLFYFNLAIIFNNKNLAKSLLHHYLLILYRCKLFDEIFDYTFFLSSKLFTEEESRDSVSSVASLSEPDKDNLFLEPLKKKGKNDEVKNLLLEIRNKIISNNQKGYLKDLKWAKLSLTTKGKIIQYVCDIINDFFKKSSYQPRATHKQINEVIQKEVRNKDFTYDLNEVEEEEEEEDYYEEEEEEEDKGMENDIIEEEEENEEEDKIKDKKADTEKEIKNDIIEEEDKIKDKNADTEKEIKNDIIEEEEESEEVDNKKGKNDRIFYKSIKAVYNGIKQVCMYSFNSKQTTEENENDKIEEEEEEANESKEEKEEEEKEEDKKNAGYIIKIYNKLKQVIHPFNQNQKTKSQEQKAVQTKDDIPKDHRIEENANQNIKDEQDDDKLTHNSSQDKFIEKSTNQLIADSAFEFFSWEEFIKSPDSYETIRKHISNELESASLISCIEINEELSKVQENFELKNYKEDPEQIKRQSLVQLTTDIIYDYITKRKKYKINPENILDDLEQNFWNSFLIKDYLKTLKWLRLDDLVKDDYLQLAIDCTYELVLRNKFLKARETYDMIKDDISDEKEKVFWNSFLPADKDDDEKVISSFKQLLFWIDSMKKQNSYPYGYETCRTDEEASRRTNKLINHLICYITNTYKEKLKDDILNGTQKYL